MLIGLPNKECRDTAHRDILEKDSDDDIDILEVFNYGDDIFELL